MSLDKIKTPFEEKDEKKVMRSSTAEKRQNKQKDAIGVVKGVQNLNVRAKPSAYADILTTLSMGTSVTVKGSVDDYYQIVTPDLTEGYVLKGFLEVRR